MASSNMMVAGCSVLLAALLLVPHALGLPTCSPGVVNLPGDKIVFAVIGDWGRQGADVSLFNPYTAYLCGTTGQCCSSLQDNNYPPDFDSGDYGYALQQLQAAALMNSVCGKVGCEFIVGMGDNFYPCGADNITASGQNRFLSDWLEVYGTSNTPYISNLTWYQIVGNHDYGFDGSVPSQVAYSKNNSKWVMSSDYQSTLFKANGVSVQLNQLDTVPFVSTYAHPPNNAYYHNEFTSKCVPSYINSDAAAYLNKTSGVCNIPPANASFIGNISSNATGQVPWLKSCLANSNATWDIVNGHFGLWGSDVQFADPSAAGTKKSGYPGNCGAWASVADLVNQYKVPLYFNGHDHTMTHADPIHAGVASGKADGYGNATYYVSPPSPQYFTLGNGGIIQYGDGVTLDAPKAFNNFSSVIFNNNVNGAPGEGFAIVTATACNITVDLYAIEDYSVLAVPVHSTVIDKCGSKTAAFPPIAPASDAQFPSTTTEETGVPAS